MLAVIRAFSSLSLSSWSSSKSSEASPFVVFHPENEEFPSYLIENWLSEPIMVFQKGQTNSDSIPPKSSFHYAWDELSQDNRKLVVKLPFISLEKELGIDKLSKPRRLARATGKTVFYQIVANGPTKIVRLTTKREASELFEEDQEESESEENALITANIVLKGLGISLIDSRPAELLYCTIEDIKFLYSDTTTRRNLELTVKHLQLDNQIYSSHYPILLYPAPSPKDFLHVSLKLATDYKSIDYICYFSVLMQAFELKVDGEFLNSMLNYVEFISKSQYLYGTAAPTNKFEKPVSFEEGPQELVSRMLYIEFFHLNPFKFYLSLYSESVTESESSISKLLSFSGGLLTSIPRSPICLGGLMLEDPFISKTEMTQRITRHYTQQVLFQLYKILGSVGFLGSPVSLVDSLGKGVKDFFYEPAEGITESPQKFGKGVIKGTSSLIGNSIRGIFSGVSDVTHSISKGITELTFDKDYKKDQEAAARDRASHVGEGLAKGAKSFGLGFVKALTGVVTKPVKGAKEEGAKGLFKGIGKGVAGLVTKPVVGTLELVSKTAEGISNTTTYFEDKKKKRKRLPRPFPRTKKLEPYNHDVARVQYQLFELEHGTSAGELYVFHFRVGKELCVILTTKTLLVTKKKKLEWAEPIQNIRDIVPKGGNVEFLFHSASSSTKIFDKAVSKRELECPATSVDPTKLCSQLKAQMILLEGCTLED